MDETLDTPSLSGTEVITNDENILIKGSADSFDEVFVYVDNEEVARVKVDSEGALNMNILLKTRVHTQYL